MEIKGTKKCRKQAHGKGDEDRKRERRKDLWREAVRGQTLRSVVGKMGEWRGMVAA